MIQAFHRALQISASLGTCIWDPICSYQGICSLYNASCCRVVDVMQQLCFCRGLLHSMSICNQTLLLASCNWCTDSAVPITALEHALMFGMACNDVWCLMFGTMLCICRQSSIIPLPRLRVCCDQRPALWPEWQRYYTNFGTLVSPYQLLRHNRLSLWRADALPYMRRRNGLIAIACAGSTSNRTRPAMSFDPCNVPLSTNLFSVARWIALQNGSFQLCCQTLTVSSKLHQLLRQSSPLPSRASCLILEPWWLSQPGPDRVAKPLASACFIACFQYWHLWPAYCTQ